MAMSGKRVALVLGSGGARGYAHIGVAQVLAERGYQVTAVAGTSIGAVIGGLIAADRLEEYTDWVVSLSQRDVLRLLDPAIAGPGAIRLERVLTRMGEILGDVLIEDLPIPYTAVATDIGARREVWFTSGPLQVAIRASVAIPGLITPIMVNGRLLVDGGVLNPVPVEPVIGADADFTLAVALAGVRATGPAGTPERETSAPRPPSEWLDRFRKSAADVWDNELSATILSRLAGRADARTATPAFDPPPPGLSVGDVTAMSLDTMGALITRFRLAVLPPDVLVTVPGDAARTLDFHRATELIALGRTLAEEALDRAFGAE